MGTMSDLDLTLQEVSAAMAEPSTADLREMEIDQLARDLRDCPVQDLIDIIVTGLDEICARANDDKTAKDVTLHERGIGQIISRAQLVLSFLDARKPTNVMSFKR